MNSIGLIEMVIEQKNIFGKHLWMDQEECKQIPHSKFNNLNILSNLPHLLQTIGFLSDLFTSFPHSHIIWSGLDHGGYILLEWIRTIVPPSKLQIWIVSQKNEIDQKICFQKNLISYSFPPSISFQFLQDHEPPKKNIPNPLLICLKPISTPFPSSISISPSPSPFRLSWFKSPLFLSIPPPLLSNFYHDFHFFISPQNNDILYNNLIHLTMIVKNAGDNFEHILQQNLPYIDRWTILDTGSTDNTIDIIHKVLVNKKKGNLFQEPFINFRDSRNRCLELAGNSCTFTIMLDDTYVLQGPLREFLETVRGDQFSDSFSLYITSDDTQYVSNRVLRSDRKLQYLYKIHEVIQHENNKNVIIPIEHGNIFDVRSNYMEERTMNRKQYDLQLLFEEVEEDPNDPRHFYYIAQTYNLLKEYNLAFEYFLKRAQHPVEGFLQEKIDAIFEAARLANFQLDKPWEQVQPLYEWAYRLDTTRPDSLYFIGIHFYLLQDFQNAYSYFKQAFLIGYPIHAQYSLKPTLSYYFLPKFLSRLCYSFKDFSLGLQVCQLFFQKNKITDSHVEKNTWEEIQSWLGIYQMLTQYQQEQSLCLAQKPYLVIVADGGWKSWNGESLLKEGVGGSETWVIEIAQTITSHQVVVFCKTDTESSYQNVLYKPLSMYFSFLCRNKIHSCIISRYSEYVPVALQCENVQNVYLILHDLGPTGNIIPLDPKLKQVFCLSDWHRSYFLDRFPSLTDRTSVFSYGIDLDHYPLSSNKNPCQFIYSSFPNRGLVHLLRMWPQIRQLCSSATLEIFCDVHGKWVNDVSPDEMIEVRQRIQDCQSLGVTLHGWVSKDQLRQFWLSSTFWLYPCTFLETFCLTALEAAAAQVLPIASACGALLNNISDRGILIEGNPSSVEWQEQALTQLLPYLELDSDSPDIKLEKLYRRQEKISSNYQWLIQEKKTWKERGIWFQENYLM